MVFDVHFEYKHINSLCSTCFFLDDFVLFCLLCSSSKQLIHQLQHRLQQQNQQQRQQQVYFFFLFIAYTLSLVSFLLVIRVKLVLIQTTVRFHVQFYYTINSRKPIVILLNCLCQQYSAEQKVVLDSRFKHLYM